MSLESLVCFSFIGVKVDCQAICQCHNWPWFGVATIFTYTQSIFPSITNSTPILFPGKRYSETRLDCSSCDSLIVEFLWCSVQWTSRALWPSRPMDGCSDLSMTSKLYSLCFGWENSTACRQSWTILNYIADLTIFFIRLECFKGILHNILAFIFLNVHDRIKH